VWGRPAEVPVNAVIEELLAAMNAHDLDAMIRLFAPDYASRQPAHEAAAFVGSDQVHANWRAMFAGVPDFRAELLRSVDDGDTAWCEWRWTGTRTDGMPFDVRGVSLFETRDGVIVAGTLYMEEAEADTPIEEAVQNLSGRRPDEPA
jgi:ketosteroid isomerase-like protein